MPKTLDIADRLESASYNGVSRTLRSNHCREAAELIRELRKEVARLKGETKADEEIITRLSINL